MEPDEVEVIVIHSEIDCVGMNVMFDGSEERYFTIAGLGARIFDNQHNFHMFDSVRITVTKEPKPDAQPQSAP